MADDDKGGQGADPTQAFQNRLAKYDGDALKFAAQLFDENFHQRGRIRELEAKVPKDDAVVLSKGEGERWKKFNDLGRKPEELETIIKEHGDSTTEVNRLKRKDTLRDVAEVGFGGSKLKLSVLEKLDGEVEGLEYEIKEGKDGKSVLVKHGGKELPLEKFAAENEKWRDFVPALKVAQGSQGASRGNGGDPPPAGSLSTLDRVREQEKKRQERAAPAAGGSLIDRWRNRNAPAA